MGKKRLTSISKLNVWLRYYLDENNKATFLQKTGSARAAAYKTKTEESLRQIGCQNFTKLNGKISKWLEEEGLSENSLKIKMLSLLEAKEIKFFSRPVDDEKGNPDILIIEREIEALETQRRTLDMAIKIKGMYAPDRHEHTGKDGTPLQIISSLPEPKPAE